MTKWGSLQEWKADLTFKNQSMLTNLNGKTK